MEKNAPFSGFTQDTIDFLWNLRFNNNRAWFEEHKAEYRRHLLDPLHKPFQGADGVCVRARPESSFQRAYFPHL